MEELKQETFNAQLAQNQIQHAPQIVLGAGDKDIDFATKIKMKSQALLEAKRAKS